MIAARALQACGVGCGRAVLPMQRIGSANPPRSRQARNGEVVAGSVCGGRSKLRALRTAPERTASRWRTAALISRRGLHMPELNRALWQRLSPLLDRALDLELRHATTCWRPSAARTPASPPRSRARSTEHERAARLRFSRNAAARRRSAAVVGRPVRRRLHAGAAARHGRHGHGVAGAAQRRPVRRAGGAEVRQPGGARSRPARSDSGARERCSPGCRTRTSPACSTPA